MKTYLDLNMNYKGGDWYINQRNINSLDGCPNHIAGDFNCYANNNTSLIGGPQQVDGDYNCSRNALVDLIGWASHIGGELLFYSNNITSLVGIHKIIKSCKEIWFDDDITEGGIGLLLIANLAAISANCEPFEIIEQYLGTGTNGMMECSKELIAKGYATYAKL